MVGTRYVELSPKFWLSGFHCQIPRCYEGVGLRVCECVVVISIVQKSWLYGNDVLFPVSAVCYPLLSFILLYLPPSFLVLPLLKETATLQESET